MTSPGTPTRSHRPTLRHPWLGAPTLCGYWSLPSLYFSQSQRRSSHRASSSPREILMTLTVQETAIPDSGLAREITELVRDTVPPLLFHHSSRVYYFGALAGKHRGLSFDPELLYAGAMFHDMGLTPNYSSAQERFEVDGANAARDFLRRHDIPQAD